MNSTYSPKKFGELIGVTTKTLQKWDREGFLKAHRTSNNRRYYTHEQYLEYRGLRATEKGLTIVYAWVPGSAQKPDLANQVKALETYCRDHHIQVDEWVEDIGSVLNYKRRQFYRIMKLVVLGQVRCIIVAHRDRLVRFGYSYFATFCRHHNTAIIAMNSDGMSPEQDLVHDVLVLVSVVGAKFHGLRSYLKAIRDAALQKKQT